MNELPAGVEPGPYDHNEALVEAAESVLRRSDLMVSDLAPLTSDTYGETACAVLDAVAEPLREQGRAEIRARVEAVLVTSANGAGQVSQRAIRSALAADPDE